MNGIYANIYKNSPDCTNNGMSVNHDRVVIYGESVKDGNVDKSWNIDESEKLYIHRNPRNINHWMASPSPDPDEMLQFGGNFVFSNDARFPSDQPIKIHDRVEESTRRLSYDDIIAITDPLHAVWNYMNDTYGNMASEAKEAISHEISIIGKKYQDVLNHSQRERVFEGVKN